MKSHTSRVLCALLLLSISGTLQATDLAPIELQSLRLDDPDRPQDRIWYDLVRLSGERARAETNRDRVPVGDYYPYPVTDGEGLTLTVPRAFARPGDRWVEIFFAIDAEAFAAGNRSLEVFVYPVGGATPAATENWKLEQRGGLLKVDLRRHALSNGRVVVRVGDGTGKQVTGEVFVSAQPLPAPSSEPRRVTIEVDVPTGTPTNAAVPVTFGVPFAAGELWDSDRLRLVDGEGREVLSQKEEIARWSPQGALRWVRFDAIAVPDRKLFVEVHPQQPKSGEKAAGQPVLELSESDDELTVDTGTARYLLGKGPSPVIGIWQDGRRILSAEETNGLYVVDQNGRLGTPHADSQGMTVEAAGPAAACVRFEGDYLTADGETLAHYILRVELFAGQAYARITHTLVLNRDSNEVWFRDIGWAFDVDAGDNQQATFGISHADRSESITEPLEPNETAYVLQEKHLRMGSGDNLFTVGIESSGDAASAILYEGERMGDWAVLSGSRGALFASVRDAALQHPKEFTLAPGRMVIRLFSNRAGEELDFRAATLAEKWGLSDTYKRKDGEEVPLKSAVAAHESNAVGWAKTHELMIAPISDRNSAPRLATINADKIYAHVDPAWIHASRAMGPVYPEDRETYAGAEHVVDDLLATFQPHLRGQAFYGFVDYNAGPSFHPRGSSGNLAMERRFGMTYQLRPGLWSVYARSGRRDARSFAEQTGRVYRDNYMAHWDSDSKVRGLFMEGPSGAGKMPLLQTGNLPFYWEEGTVVNRQDRTNMNDLVYDYYLTGNRRALDILQQYVRGILSVWDPRTITGYKRKTETFRSMLQAYWVTLDPELRAITEATISYLYDPEGETAFTQNKEGGVSYKARISILAVMEGWEVFGTPPYYDMAMRMGIHLWKRYLPLQPLTATTSPFGLVGNFLYRQTGDPTYLRGLELNLRRAPLQKVSTAPFKASYPVTGISATLDALAGADSSELQRVSWAAWEESEQDRPVSVILNREQYDIVDVQILTTEAAVRDGGGSWIHWLESKGEHIWTQSDLNLIRMNVSNNLSGKYRTVDAEIHFPEDLQGATFQIKPPYTGSSQLVTATVHRPAAGGQPEWMKYARPYEWRGRVPLVLYAPDGWRTSNFPAKIYFQVAEEASAARIYFSEPTRLYHPDGTSYADGERQQGWVELPGDVAGLWSFQLDGKPQNITVENCPPFFAFDDPENFFVPTEEMLESQHGRDPSR